MARNIPDCAWGCHKPVVMSTIECRNHKYTGVCKDCHITYAFDYLEAPYDVFFVANMQKRFKHNGVVWNMTFRREKQQTTYVTVQKQKKPEWIKGIKHEFPKDRIEHVFDGMVLPERFIQLIAFL